MIKKKISEGSKCGFVSTYAHASWPRKKEEERNTGILERVFPVNQL